MTQQEKNLVKRLTFIARRLSDVVAAHRMEMMGIPHNEHFHEKQLMSLLEKHHEIDKELGALIGWPE